MGVIYQNKIGKYRTFIKINVKKELHRRSALRLLAMMCAAKIILMIYKTKLSVEHETRQHDWNEFYIAQRSFGISSQRIMNVIKIFSIKYEAAL